MLNIKEIPFERGNCDTCLEEDIMVLKCTVNNKCEYTMCPSCMTELKYITKTNLCPNCREVKEELISDDEIIIEIDDESTDSNEDEQIYTGCQRCCEWCEYECACCFMPFIYFYICCCIDGIGGFFSCYYEMIDSCVDVGSLRYRPKLRKAIVIGIMIFLLLLVLFLGGVVYSALFGTHPIHYIISNFGLFLFHSILGFFILFAFIFGIVLVCMCCCECQ